MRGLLFSFVLLAGAYLFTSCMPSRSGGAGRPGFLKIFVKGKDSLMYFAGPMYYTSKSGERMEIDFTYLSVKNTTGLVVCNFTLTNQVGRFAPEKLSIQAADTSITVHQFEHFFSEPRKKSYAHRYSFSIPDRAFYKWMKAQDPIIKINDIVLRKGKKHSKHATLIRRQVLFDKYPD